MLSVRLTPKLEARLHRLAKRTGRTKGFYARRAITEFLYLIALSRLENELPPIPLEKVVKQLGLDRSLRSARRG